MVPIWKPEVHLVMNRAMRCASRSEHGLRKAAVLREAAIKLGQLPEPMQEVQQLPVQVWEALPVVSKASGSVVQLQLPEPAWGAMRVPVRLAVSGSARQQLGVVISARS